MQFFVLAAIKNCGWRNGYLTHLADEALVNDGHPGDYLDESYMGKLYEKDGIKIPLQWFSEPDEYVALCKRIDDKKAEAEKKKGKK
jgi:hypothetical protein